VLNNDQTVSLGKMFFYKTMYNASATRTVIGKVHAITTDGGGGYMLGSTHS
jgi:hypothetical protein